MTRTKELILLAAGLVLAVLVAVLALTPVGDPVRMAVGEPTTIAYDRFEQVATDPFFTDTRISEHLGKRAASTSLFFGRYPADGFVRVRNYPTTADPVTDPLAACQEIQAALVEAGWTLTRECYYDSSPIDPGVDDHLAYAARLFEGFCSVAVVNVFPTTGPPSVEAGVPYDTRYAPGPSDDCQSLVIG